ncbi:MAG: hypothetical protein WC045_02425 [Patescibacteria group bacterium]
MKDMKDTKGQVSATPRRGGKFVKFLMIIIFLGALGSAGYFYSQFAKLKKNPNAIAQEEVKTLVAQVGKIFVLPKEDPSVATVLKKEELKDQPFFKNAENGDKVLIYTTAKKAILYRPSTNMVVEVMPLSIGNEADTKKATTSSTNTSSNTSSTSSDSSSNNGSN